MPVLYATPGCNNTMQRKAPIAKARETHENVVAMGQDGQEWIVVRRGTINRWVRLEGRTPEKTKILGDHMVRHGNGLVGVYKHHGSNMNAATKAMYSIFKKSDNYVRTAVKQTRFVRSVASSKDASLFDLGKGAYLYVGKQACKVFTSPLPLSSLAEPAESSRIIQRRVVSMTDFDRGARMCAKMSLRDSNWLLNDFHPLLALEAMGAASRLVGGKMVRASDAAKLKVGAKDREVFRKLVSHRFVKAEREYKAAYAAMKKAIPKGATVLSIGSSPDKLAFKYELEGHDVKYVSFSRSLTEGDLVTNALFDSPEKELLCKRIRKSLKDAGVSMNDVRDRTKKFAIVDYVSTGGSFITLLELMGACLGAPDFAERTTVVVLSTGDEASLANVTRFKYTIKKVDVAHSIWELSKQSRCVRKERKDAPDKLSDAQVAMCNAIRLWIKDL